MAQIEQDPKQRDISGLRIHRDGPPEPGRFRPLLYLAAAAILAVVIGVLFANRGKLGLTPAPEVTTAVVAATAPSATGIVLTASGYVVARTEATISAKVPGRLAFLGVEEGSHVRKGQVIARLENADLQAQVREAEAQVADAEREFKRQAELLERGLTPRSTFDAAETRRAVTRAQLDLARATLDNTIIRVPFDGTVLTKDAEVGETVSPGSISSATATNAIVTIADLKTLEAEVDVNETNLSKVRDGQPAEVRVDAFPGRAFPGRVRQILPTANRQKAIVVVRVAIVEGDPNLRPEMSAKVNFLAGEKPSGAIDRPRILVPAGAVRNDAGARVVFLFENGKAVRRAVEAGPEEDGEVEIQKGLSGGEILITEGPDALADGGRVRLRKP